MTNLQDRDLVELNQRGVNSVGYVPGPYCREAESLVLRFVDWYCEKAEAFIAGRPEATTPDASRPITLDRAFAPARPSLPAISPDAS